MEERKNYNPRELTVDQLERLRGRFDSPLKPNEFLKPGELEGSTGPRSRSSRQFDTGATRDTDKGKYDYEGFLSPLVLERFAQYMHKHRKQSNEEIRDSDNWQKGIPVEQYIKSGERHFMDWWLIHRGCSDVAVEELEEALCGLFFNVQGYLFEVIKKRRAQK